MLKISERMKIATIENPELLSVRLIGSLDQFA
jgi:hypothetical protein